MPQLKHLSCSIQWSKSGVAFQEYGTLYGDGVVESFIVVPDTPQPFTIHIRSRGFVYEGLAAIVFVDGNYQTNRNRVNLVPPARDRPLSRTEIDFLFRQKEKPHGDGVYMGREWRFDDHNIVSELPAGIKEDHFDNLGTIEVLVLRCRATVPEEALASPVSSGADSDVFCERPIDDDAIDATTKIDEAVQDTEETILYGMGMSDGADDRAYPFNPNGQGPPPGAGWQGHPHNFTPGRSVPSGNHEQYSSSQGLPHHQYLPNMHSISHMQTPHPGPAAPEPERHVHFDYGSQGLPPNPLGPAMYPVNFRPPSYERQRYFIPSVGMVNPANGHPSHSEPSRPPCGYPSTPCQCGLHHNLNPNLNNHNQNPLQAWQNQPDSYLHVSNPYRRTNIHQPTVGSLMPNYPVPAQQYYPHIVPPYAQWPGPIQIPYRFTPTSTWPVPPPYSIPPTKNETNLEAVNDNPQQNRGDNLEPQQTNGSQDQNAQTIPNNTWANSSNEVANNQHTTGNAWTQPDQPQQQNTNPDTTHGTTWDDNNNANNGQQNWPANTDNGNGNPNDNQNDNGNSWVDNNDTSNDNNNTWANNDTSNDNNNNSWTDNDAGNGGGNDTNANNNNQTVDNDAWGGGNDGGGNDTGNWNNSNGQPQDDKKENPNDHGVVNATIASQSSCSRMRPLFGPHGQYYTWEPQDADAPSPDAPEEPRYDVPKSIADTKRTTKQVQPGQGYLYCKKRSVPEYIDDMNEPYARFVFKYRTREQVKNELGIEIEAEPTGDESIQELQNMDKQALIEMLIRAKGALGGKVPSPPPNPAVPGGEGSAQKTPVPVDPPVHTFLKYQLPPVRLPANTGNAGKYSDTTPHDKGATGTDWNANCNSNNQQDNNWNTDTGNGSGGWNNSGNQDNRGTGWDGVLEKEPTAAVTQQTWGSPAGNENRQSHFQNQMQNPDQPGYIPIPPPPPPPPIPNTASAPSQPQTVPADNDWNMQNIPSAISSPASVLPPFNSSGTAGGSGSNQPPAWNPPPRNSPTNGQPQPKGGDFW